MTRYTLGFVCVQNAGRSQMATAFAERERTERGLDDSIEITTGGTRPAETVHDIVVRIMDEEGFDLSDRTPRRISTAELDACDVVATMGCSTLELDADVDVRDWALEDPDGTDEDEARRIREEVRENVSALFDEVEKWVETQLYCQHRSEHITRSRTQPNGEDRDEE